MNNLDKLSADIKNKQKKLSLSDIPSPMMNKNTVSEKQKRNTLISTEAKTEKEARVKRTVYLSASVNQALDMIYALRIQKGKKTELSDIVSEAVQALYAKEVKTA